MVVPSKNQELKFFGLRVKKLRKNTHYSNKGFGEASRRGRMSGVRCVLCQSAKTSSSSWNAAHTWATFRRWERISLRKPVQWNAAPMRQRGDKTRVDPAGKKKGGAGLRLAGHAPPPPRHRSLLLHQSSQVPRCKGLRRPRAEDGGAKAPVTANQRPRPR